MTFHVLPSDLVGLGSSLSSDSEHEDDDCEVSVTETELGEPAYLPPDVFGVPAALMRQQTQV